jgi:cyclic beta-1,2-glucan synthetase
MAMAMEFGFLFDKGRRLLSIGYRCNDGSLDPNYYDLLASEARLASFLAIAKGDVAAEHWFHLGRTLTPINGGSGLISWSGSMFEYLMPSLVMRSPSGSLIEETNRLSVWRQEKYGNELGAYPNPNSMPAISNRPINIPALAYPTSASNADWVKAPSSRLTRPASLQ